MKIRPTDICIFLSYKHGNAWITYQGCFSNRDRYNPGSFYKDLVLRSFDNRYFVIRVDAVNAEIWKAFK